MGINFSDLMAAETLESTVPAPEWGGDIRLVKMSAADRWELLEFQGKLDMNDDGTPASEQSTMLLAVEILAKTIRDEDGKKPFDTGEGREFLAVADMSLLNRISQAAIDLNGLRPEAVNEEQKDAKKN